MNTTYEEMLRYELAYRVGEPKITDAEWDKLVLETGYKEHIGDTLLMKFEDSDNGRPRVEMKTPMISLKKVYNVEELKKWLKANFNEDEDIIIEPKLDGNAVNISYEVLPDGTARRKFIGSPGDGLISMITFPDALKNVKIYGAPEFLSKESVDKYRRCDAIIDGIIENRGEAIIDRNQWEKSNPGFTYETWRQMVAAIMCRQSGLSWKTVEENLDKTERTKITDRKSKNREILLKSGLIKAFVEYFKEGETYIYFEDGNWIVENSSKYKLKDILPELVEYGSKIKCYEECLNIITYSCSTNKGNKSADFLRESIDEVITFEEIDLRDMTDEPLDTTRVVTNLSEFDLIDKYIEKFFGVNEEGCRNIGSFQCDGLVFKHRNAVDKDVFKTRTGKIAHDPSNSIALKLMPNAVETEILEIYENKTEKGNITVRAKIKPVKHLGSTITNINFFNRNWVEERKDWVYEGAKIMVTFSGDLIPVISKPKN